MSRQQRTGPIGYPKARNSARILRTPGRLHRAEISTINALNWLSAAWCAEIGCLRHL